MNLPKLTIKQREILNLLYKHRFLNRIQIQAFLHHKDYKTINVWLRDLREKQYVAWIYSTHFAEKTKPAFYYLGLNAIRYYRQNDLHAEEHLHKYYREPHRSQAFVDRCSLLADACLALGQGGGKHEHGDTWYYYETEAEYTEDGYFTFLKDTDIHPHLCLSKQGYDANGEETTLESHVVEVFDPTLPRYSMRKRLKQYVQFLDSEEWQSETDEDTPPVAMFICPAKADMIYCKRVTKKLLEDAWNAEQIHMRFAMVESVKKLGFRARIWEEVAPPETDD
jgi:hypothetical protein